MRCFVEHCDARDFRDEIVSLFGRNGTPISPDHFDWYYGHNGGATVSWVLRRSPDDDIGGLCSVVPRTLRFGDTLVRAGVMGNLMVDKGSRGIGGLALLRSAQSLVLNGQLDILLGMPTAALPIKMIQHLGFRIIGAWQTYLQIFHSRVALCARYGTAGAVLSPAVDLIAGLRRRISSFHRASVFNLTLEDLNCSETCRLAIENWPPLNGHFLAEYSATMLGSRFLREPLGNYRLIGVVDREDKIIRGYLIVESRRGRVIVWHCRTDVRALSERDAILSLCRHGRSYADTFGVITLRGSTLSSTLESSGFVSLPPVLGGAEHSLFGFWKPDHPLARYFQVPSSWNVFPGFSDV
jgi:hypothetical protein